MDVPIPEASYPISFRAAEVKRLGEYLRHRQSVNLIGMKRVGISSFLRFFLYNKENSETSLGSDQTHLFIPVDLNDLVEREIYPFWTLTLKRIVDASDESELAPEAKRKINALFLISIQSQDLFFVIDSIRKALSLLFTSGIYPTLFFVRFDRLQNAFNPSFFDNLEGLRESIHDQLSYVFTSYRSLDSLFPLAKTVLSLSSQILAIKPAKTSDIKIIYESYLKRYGFILPKDSEAMLFSLVAGNAHYLQIALMILKETPHKEANISHLLLGDERIGLLSEELWESLTNDEKKVLLKVAKGQKFTAEERTRSQYLWETGFIAQDSGKEKVFSPLLVDYILHREQRDQKKNHSAHLTRKEHLLYQLLESQLGEICEREKIIESVWPESVELGVSDWAIDRLVARVRSKLKEQKHQYEIVTVRTRGYKLSGMLST